VAVDEPVADESVVVVAVDESVADGSVVDESSSTNQSSMITSTGSSVASSSVSALCRSCQRSPATTRRTIHERHDARLIV
jgi:hypothetical protein